jgi:anaerobic magnesium-protoporphyrin IX monomethyl ester cyclase
MKVLLLNPPFLKNFSRSQRSPAVTKSGTLYFPLWLASAAGLLESRGITVDLIDAPADDHGMDYVLQRARKFPPDLIVVDTSTPSIANDVGVAAQLKDAFPKSFVVLVGTHVSALPEESLSLSEQVDAVARGEYDTTLLDLAETLGRQADVRTVAGLTLRENGKFITTATRPLIEDLDAIPFVSAMYRKFLRIENYFNPNALFPMVTITTSRGCPFQCIFCVYPQTMMGHRVRLRSVANVVDEMEYIVKNFPGVKAIFFEDDTFAAIRKRCIEISEEIIRRGIKISWSINARADLDYEAMKVMKAAGCRCMCVGFESGSKLLLENIKKKMTIEKMHQFVADARKAGILVHGCFMVGHPGETKETMEQTLDLAKQLTPDTVQFYPIMVYPGTEAFRWYQERGLITTDDFSKWITPAGLHNTVVRTEALSSEDLVRFCDHARREFYLRPRYLLYKLKQTLTDPSERKRNLKSARTFMKYLIKGSDVKGTEGPCKSCK